MVNRTLLLAAVILFTATAALAVWRGPPQMVAALDDETRDWVRWLTNNYGGSCCDTADGYPVEVDGWDMAGTVDDTSGLTKHEAFYARSGYRVRLADGNWHDVPNLALVPPDHIPARQEGLAIPDMPHAQLSADKLARVEPLVPYCFCIKFRTAALSVPEAKSPRLL